MLEIHCSAVLVDPPRAGRRRPEESGLASFHPLLLAVCRETRRFPAGDPLELGHGIRNTALSAAEAVLGACELRALPQARVSHADRGCEKCGPAFASALVEAVRRLRELGCCIEVARRLGYLGEAPAAELMVLHARATRAVSVLLAEETAETAEARAGPTTKAEGLSNQPEGLSNQPEGRSNQPEGRSNQPEDATRTPVARAAAGDPCGSGGAGVYSCRRAMTGSTCRARRAGR